MDLDFNILECFSQGVIVKKIGTPEILYTNLAMRNMLNLTNTESILSMYQLINSEDAFLSTSSQIIKDLNKNNVAYGSVFFRHEDATLYEYSFKCTYLDREHDIVLFVFDIPSNYADFANSKDLDLNLVEVTEFLPNGIMVMSIEPELSIKYANKEQYKILNMDSNTEKFNSLFSDSIYEEDRDWVISEIYQNLDNKVDVDIEFRMKEKNNNIKWVRLYGRENLSNGERLFYSSLKDLSNRREINDKLYLERVLFNKITEISDEIIFRLDLKTDTIYFMGKNASIFGDNSKLNNFPKCFLDLNIIYEEDMPKFMELVDALKSGKYLYTELRHCDLNGDHEWYKPIYSFVKDNSGEPVLAIGKFVNINYQKILQEQAKRDLLTGFYNKVSTESEVDAVISLSQTNEHALFIIDLDNFKAINDNLGHHFGDFVLKEVARDLKDCFRKDDILGRIGGDEFIILLKNCIDLDVITEKAIQVCNALQKTYHSNNTSYAISTSIGIAICPEDGDNFEALYQKADKALYYSKEHGRNCFTFYSKDFKSNSPSIMVPNLNHSNRRKYELIDNEIVDDVFNLLYEADDIPSAVITTLKYLASHYDVQRCYIYEHDGDSNYLLAYQWESKYIEVNSMLENIDEEIIDSIFSKSNDDGIFYINNINLIPDPDVIHLMQADNVQSTFLVESRKKSNHKMFFGLDDCLKNRNWKEKDIKTLNHVVRMIFLIIMNYNDIMSKNNSK